MTPAEKFAAQHAALMARLPSSESGQEWCAAYSSEVDTLIRNVSESTVGLESDAVFGLMAVGGYGRSEMAPYSDADLLVVPVRDAHPAFDESVRNVHRALLRSLEKAKGPAISYAFFLQNDAAALDFKTLTALLDARVLFGDPSAIESFINNALSSMAKGEFVLEKIRERKSAEARWNDTPLAVEPNLKEGAGGLRAWQAAQWLRQATGRTRRDSDQAYDNVLRFRNLLHYSAGKVQDTFSRSRQGEVADLLGLNVSAVFSECAESLLQLHREWEQARRDLHRGSFTISPAVQVEDGVARPSEKASLSEAAIGIAMASDLGFDVMPSEVLSDRVNGPEALHALLGGEAALRDLDRAGILGELLPELERCRTLAPDDAIHAFTVFEHSLRTVRHIAEFSMDSFYGRLREGLSDRGALVLAALLHDVGKAIAGRPHSESGADLARETGRRWNLAPGTAENVEWLVREHLTMARFIGMRDIGDTSAVKEFAAIVGDRERLDMLTILTCADVSAVAPNAWTPAQDAFLRELHERTALLLDADVSAPADAETMRRRVVRSLKDHPVDPGMLQKFLDTMPAQYAVHTSPDLVPVHMELVERARRGDPSAVWDHDREKRLSDITICALDRPGLLTQILGVLYAFDLSVYGIRANTTRGETAVALDTVLASFGNQPVPPATSNLVARSLVEIIQGRASLSELLASRGKDPDRKQENFRFEFVEGSPGILEIRAPRGRGMAYRISRLIWNQGWNIVAARIGQWAGQGAAAFYLLGPDGRRLEQDEVQNALNSDRP